MPEPTREPRPLTARAGIAAWLYGHDKARAPIASIAEAYDCADNLIAALRGAGIQVMPPREQAIERVAKALLDNGAEPGNSIHSWRCEHPDHYGPCNCVAEVAAEVVDALLGGTDE